MPEKMTMKQVKAFIEDESNWRMVTDDLLDREQYVIELVMNSEIGRKMAINEIMDIMNTVEGIFHGMF